MHGPPGFTRRCYAFAMKWRSGLLFLALSASGACSKVEEPPPPRRAPSATTSAPSSATSSTADGPRVASAVPPAPPTVCDAAGELKPSAFRVHGLDVHNAARFLADVHRENVLIVGDADDPRRDACPGPCLDLDAIATDLETAARSLPLPVERRGALVFLGARSLPTSRPPLPESRTVDLSLHRAATTEAAELLGSVMNRKVEGMPAGEITLALREVPADEALLAVVDAVGARVERSDAKTVSLKGGAAPPASPIRALCERDRLRAVKLSCIPLDDLVVGAVGRSERGAPTAMLIARGPDSARPEGQMVSVGDYVGHSFIVKRPDHDYAENARVTRIGCDTVELDNGVKLHWR